MNSSYPQLFCARQAAYPVCKEPASGHEGNKVLVDCALVIMPRVIIMRLSSDFVDEQPTFLPGRNEICSKRYHPPPLLQLPERLVKEIDLANLARRPALKALLSAISLIVCSRKCGCSSMVER